MIVFEVLRVAGALPTVELMRRTVGLHGAVDRARKRGMTRTARSPESRRALKRVIAALDRRWPGGGNCVRRSLAELALDSGAASERFFAGFRAGGGLQSGHAWLESEAPRESYDAVVSI